ncbi:hypothetical protein E2C01_053015 [Portunus trituberculatus]|uniref:Uncharacterized protein n=1 Tax=Portunus trituberculatus TaxID=210409 RepID=A0A5B7GFA8_PORTR|nr:hypothetical protein [Portunus trituberculatus]
MLIGRWAGPSQPPGTGGLRTRRARSLLEFIGNIRGHDYGSYRCTDGTSVTLQDFHGAYKIICMRPPSPSVPLTTQAAPSSRSEERHIS